LTKTALNKVKTTDANFLDLKAAVNATGTMQVYTAKSVTVGKFGNQEFFFTSKEEIAKARGRSDVVAIGGDAPIDRSIVPVYTKGQGERPLIRRNAKPDPRI